MVLELTTKFSSGWSSRDMGGLATWYNENWDTQWSNFQNRSTWWYDNTADILYGRNGQTCCVQFGCDRNDYASARGFFEKIWWSNEVVNSDNSVDADVTLFISNIMGYKTTHSQAGYPAETTITLAGQTVGHRVGNTIDNWTIPPDPCQITKHVHIPPSQTAEGIDLVYFTHYPTGVYPDSPINLGFSLYNPLPPAYKPMAIRKGNWKSLDANNGFIKIRKSGNWQDKSEETNLTVLQENQGHNRIRRSGKWLQLPKM